MSLRLVPSQPVVCPGRTTPYPPALDSPLFWLREGVPEGYQVADFDGFIVTKRQRVKRLLLLREFSMDKHDELDITELLRQTKQPQELWDARWAVAKRLGVGVDAVFCPKDYPLEQPEEALSITYVSEVQPHSYKRGNVTSMNLIDLQARIASLRGFSFSQAYVKPLNSARTQLECALSRTGNPWPGDLDGVILKRDQPICLLEFKTHNQRTPIEQEHIGKYGKADWRRFKVLSAMQQALSDIPILFIVWGPRHSQVKIDKIVSSDQLSGSAMALKEPSVLAEAVLALSQ